MSTKVVFPRCIFIYDELDENCEIIVIEKFGRKRTSKIRSPCIHNVLRTVQALNVELSELQVIIDKLYEIEEIDHDKRTLH